LVIKILPGEGGAKVTTDWKRTYFEKINKINSNKHGNCQ
jgi:hypothetical protein